VQTSIEPTDSELIREYARSKSETAFAELAARHADWIYSSALRQTRDAHLAEDVAQAVFIVLAKKASALTEKTALNAWLFQVTRYAAGHALRADIRRRRHERAAASMISEISSGGEQSDWQRVEPWLDEAVGRLHQEDRRAILLRFYQKKSMAEVGLALNVSEDAAKKRVARAVDGLRKMLRGKGVAVGAAGLASALAAGTTHSAPAGVLASCAGASVAQSPAAALVIAKKTIFGMIAAKLKVAGAVVLLATLIPIAGVGTYLLYREPTVEPAAVAVTPADNERNQDDGESQAALAAMQGKWNDVVLMMDGSAAEAKLQGSTLIVAGNMATISNAHSSETARLRIYTSMKPPQIDFVQGGKVSKGIFLLEHDHLVLCWGQEGVPRPEEFVTRPKDNRRLADCWRGSTSADAKDKELVEALQGTWTSASVSTKGAAAEAHFQHASFVIAGNKVNEAGEPASHGHMIAVDASHSPVWIDIASDSGQPTLGIVEIQGGEFRMCWTDPGGVRPTDFTTSASDGRWLGEFQRTSESADAKPRH